MCFERLHERHTLTQLRVEGLVIYYLVPHTLLPGVEVKRVARAAACHLEVTVCVQAPFSIRVYCSHAIELQRVPSPR